MITYIRGTLVYKGEHYVILEANNIGYQIQLAENSIYQLPNINTEIQLFTYLQAKEDLIGLFGFLSMEDLELFKKLITVNGIGPKGALGILGALTPEQLLTAIMSEDIKALSKAPGIGKKTAGRIILDLKDKIDASDLLFDRMSPSKEGENMTIGESGVDLEEALDVLIALGYSKSDAYKAVTKVDKNYTDVQQVVKEALKVLSKI